MSKTSGSGGGSAKGGLPGDRVERAEYMFDVLQGLVMLARSDPERMALLVFLLEMAAIEADTVRRKARP